jgi:hypothetical protein
MLRLISHQHVSTLTEKSFHKTVLPKTPFSVYRWMGNHRRFCSHQMKMTWLNNTFGLRLDLSLLSQRRDYSRITAVRKHYPALRQDRSAFA